jgi:hypothetical protein
MTVYVDEPNKPYGRMLMCHMMADSSSELIRMAVSIGVNPKWIQDKGSYREHFDIAKSKREMAIAKGAIAITNRDMGRYSIAKRNGFKWRPGDDQELFFLEQFRSLGYEHVHLCPEWDFMAIHDRSPEFEACTCTFPEIT